MAEATGMLLAGYNWRHDPFAECADCGAPSRRAGKLQGLGDSGGWDRAGNEASRLPGAPENCEVSLAIRTSDRPT